MPRRAGVINPFPERPEKLSDEGWEAGRGERSGPLYSQQPEIQPALLLTAGSEGPASLAPRSCQQQLGTGQTVLNKWGMEAAA